MRLDIGGGKARGDGIWTTLDIDPALKPDIVADGKNLPFIETNSVNEIFASHVLEHFSQRDTIEVLKEWFRILKPRAKVTIYVPNPIKAFQLWQIRECSDSWLVTLVFGCDPDASIYQNHKCMFWPERLKQLLQGVGFLNIVILPSRGGGRGTWEEFGCTAIKSM